MVRFACIVISSLPAYLHTTYYTAYTDACKTYRTILVHTTVLLKMNPRVRNM